MHATDTDPHGRPGFRHLRRGTALALALLLQGCGSGHGTADRPAAASSHVLGGSISGLAGAGLVIANGGDTLGVEAGSTAFAMPAAVPAGAAYALRVRTQPAGQSCSFANAAGTMPDADMRNAVLTCAAQAYTVGGSIAGLAAAGLVLTDGTDDLAVASGATRFTLPAAVATGGSWSVRVRAQPAGQLCAVANGSGQMGDAAVTDVQVRCAAAPAGAWSLGGNVRGLGDGTLVLANGDDSVRLSADGGFVFAQPLPAGAGYDVVVRSNPDGRSCAVANGSGTMGTAAVMNVSVTCAANAFTLGGSVSGLSADGLLLANGSDVLRVAAHAGAFTMGQPVPAGAAYDVVVRMQPRGLRCIAGNNAGTMGTADVTGVAVACAPVAAVGTLAGSGAAGFADGSAADARFHDPTGVVLDADGALLVADASNSRIRRVAADGTTTTLAGGNAGYAEGSATTAQFSYPFDVSTDGRGNVLVADSNNHRIRRIAADGTVSTLAGSGNAGFADGSAATARFDQPFGVAADADGNVYVADYNNHRIRRIAPGGAVSTLAGDGVPGHADGPGSAARFSYPTDLVLDPRGGLLVVDSGNHRIRRVAPDGRTSTVAGSGTAGYADGPATIAQFRDPRGLATDAAGNVFVADYGNNRIRRIAADGTVGTVAGDGVSGFADGSAATARFSNPASVAATANGDLLVGDRGNHRIRRIVP
ncbi:MAG: NHL repeat-containing protein [Xylophilus ampelinus]